MHYVYVLRQVGGGRFYLGFTSDLRRRLKEHNAGGNTSTRGSRWRLLYYEAYWSEEAARAREAKLKRNRRMQQLLMARLKSPLEKSD